MSGNPAAEDGSDLARLIPAAYDELRRIARRRMAELRPGGTLAPTDLVNEVLLRLLQSGGEQRYAGPDHLVRVAAQAMHNVLVDGARRRVAVKRGGGELKRVDLDDDLPIAAPADNMLRFDEVCEAVRLKSPDDYELILLRIYAGLSTAEIAAQRRQSERTIDRRWRFIKAVLHRSLTDAGAPCGSRPSR